VASTPWHAIRQNEGRLDPRTGLLLAADHHLFDRRFIGFGDSGTLIISLAAHRPSLERMGIETKSIVNVRDFSERQRRFLDCRRNAVLLRAAR
jgi:putative restriction endonuclease